MSRIASLPLFVDDFEAATAHLTLEEDGAYNRLLRLCWRQSDCTIPDDNDWIARHMRCDKDTFLRVVFPILEEFFTRKDGRVFQGRLSDEHAYVKEAVSKRKKAGSKGGINRALKNKENASSNANVLLGENSSNAKAMLKHPSPSPSPTPVDNTDVLSINPKEPKKPKIENWAGPNDQAHKIGEGEGYTKDEIEYLAEGFKNYVAGKSGKSYKDLDRGFYNWIRSGISRNEIRERRRGLQAGGNGPGYGGNGSQGKVGGTVGAAQSILDRWREEDKRGV